MGKAKEFMIEKQQEKADRNLAKKLGLSYNELMELDYEIDTNESKDGLIYNYIIEFSTNSPKNILNKIKGLNGYSLSLFDLE